MSKESSYVIKENSGPTSLQDLNKKFPICQLLSSKNIIYVSTITKLGWSDILRNSPARNPEAEILISKIIVSAIKNKNWIDIPLCEDSPKLININFATKIKNCRGKELIRPTEKLILFAKERLLEFAPQKNQP